jgi:uncharacterized membrane protein YcaP (DUF421 family)
VHGCSSLEDEGAFLDTPARHHGQVTAAPELGDDARLAHVLKGVPTVVVENGHVLSARISEEDVLEAARRAHGLERIDEIKFAIFEASGRISIIPKRNIVAGEDGNAPRGD